jgi:protein involved in polysaccharide export with SLBB domain
MRFVLMAVFLSMLSSCSTGWDASGLSAPPDGLSIGDQGQRPVPAATGRMEPPYGSSAVAAAYEFGGGYRIGAGDRVSAVVMGEPELSREYLVDGGGMIMMPLIGRVMIAGRTPEEAALSIRGKLQSGYLRNPQVSLQVVGLRPFFILGEVNQAGSFSYQPGMNVQNAIAIGGGYTARADQGKVLVTRKSAAGTETFRTSVTAQLFPGDIVYVRERWF